VRAFTGIAVLGTGAACPPRRLRPGSGRRRLTSVPQSAGLFDMLATGLPLDHREPPMTDEDRRLARAPSASCGSTR
jgi:hypothetical protein